MIKKYGGILIVMLLIATLVLPVMGNKESPSNTGNIIIQNISGGFGVSAWLHNEGSTALNDIGWSISFEAFVPIGYYSDGNIAYLDARESVKISSGFLLGIGPGWFRVSAGGFSESQDCFVIGPFVILR